MAQGLQGSGVASDVNKQLQAAAGSQGANFAQPVDPRILVANIIKIALEVLGTIFFVLTIYAGFLWMTAGGNEENIEKAKKVLTASVIGLVIILCAYSITYYVTTYVLLSNAPTGYTVPAGYSVGGGYGGPGCCFPVDHYCDQSMSQGDCTAARNLPANAGRGIWWTDNCTSCT